MCFSLSLIRSTRISSYVGCFGGLPDLQMPFHFARPILLSSREALYSLSAGELKRELDGAPLISFGGMTTPAGALISSRAALASPLVATGAISATDTPLNQDLGRVWSSLSEVHLNFWSGGVPKIGGS